MGDLDKKRNQKRMRSFMKARVLLTSILILPRSLTISRLRCMSRSSSSCRSKPRVAFPSYEPRVRVRVRVRVRLRVRLRVSALVRA